jgi:hypothetical protein
MPSCAYIFKKGKNVGNVCGKENCRMHKPLVVFESFPDALIPIIIEKVIRMRIPHKEIFKRLLSYQMISKEFKFIVDKNWVNLYNILDIDNTQRENAKMLTYKQKLHLFLETGCQRCDAVRITKIHWPFPIRICQNCIKDVCITEYRLKKEFFIDYKSEVFINYINVSPWHRNRGITNFKFYWKYLVEKDIGKKLIDSFMNDHKREIARELEIPYKDILLHSYKYKLEAYPSKQTVEEEYYKSLANIKFKKEIKQYDNLPAHQIDNKHIRDENCAIGQIKNKTDYETWLNTRMVVFKENYNKFLKVKIYNKFYDDECSKITYSVIGIPYFSKFNWRNIDSVDIQKLSIRDKENDTIELIKNDLPDCKKAVAEFIKNNKPEYFENNKYAQYAFDQTTRYPAKIPDNVNEFCRLYFAYQMIPEQYTNNIVKSIKTWNDTLELVEKSTHDCACEICNIRFDYISFLEHDYLIHASFKELPLQNKIDWYEWINKKPLSGRHYKSPLDIDLMLFVFGSNKEFVFKNIDKRDYKWLSTRCEHLGLIIQPSTKSYNATIKITMPESWQFDKI